MFEEIKKDKHIERLKKKIRKLQKDKDSDYQLYQIEIDQLKSEIHRLTTLETEHKKINVLNMSSVTYIDCFKSG